MPAVSKDSSTLLNLEKVLGKHIRPVSFPLAFRIATDNEPISERPKRPDADPDLSIAICRTLFLARRYGCQIVVGQEDNSPFLRSFKTKLGFPNITINYLRSETTWRESNDGELFS